MSLLQSLRTLGRPIVVHRQVAAAFGILEGHFIEQIAYWMERADKEADDWVYKTAAEIEDEIGLTYRQQTRIREKLVELNVLQERHDRLNHTIYFKINGEMFDSLVTGVYTKMYGTSTDETSYGHMTKGQVPPDERSVRIKEHRLQHRLQDIEGDPRQDFEPEPKTTSDRDLAELWRSMRRAYKRLTGKSLGTGLRGTPGDKFRELVSGKGQDKVLAGFMAFIEHKGKEQLRRFSYSPIFIFMKEAEEWIDDAAITEEQPQDEARNSGPRGVGSKYAKL